MERTQNTEAIAGSLAEFAGTLNPRQSAILRGRVINGLLGEDQRCAKTFGVSKQRVGQIEKQLRSKLCAHFTRSFGTDGIKAILRASF
jgi:DNA-directed RNA polymerase sigma subunit (sigma70/sigma32)